MLTNNEFKREEHKLFYNILILFISGIEIIIMIIMIVLSLRNTNESKAIQKSIIIQLSLSCIFHCFSHFLLLIDFKVSANNIWLQIEGASSFIFFMVTLLFSV